MLRGRNSESRNEGRIPFSSDINCGDEAENPGSGGKEGLKSEIAHLGKKIEENRGGEKNGNSEKSGRKSTKGRTSTAEGVFLKTLER